MRPTRAGNSTPASEDQICSQKPKYAYVVVLIGEWGGGGGGEEEREKGGIDPPFFLSFFLAPKPLPPPDYVCYASLKNVIFRTVYDSNFEMGPLILAGKKAMNLCTILNQKKQHTPNVHFEGRNRLRNTDLIW